MTLIRYLADWARYVAMTQRDIFFAFQYPPRAHEYRPRWGRGSR